MNIETVISETIVTTPVMAAAHPSHFSHPTGYEASTRDEMDVVERQAALEASCVRAPLAHK